MRPLFAIVALFACVIPSAPAFGQSWPIHPIRLVVGAPAGSGIDFTIRTLADRLREELGQAVIVDNKAGADGIIAAREVARAAPDGYTFLPATPAQMTINPVLRDDLPYDPLKDFEPVSMISHVPLVLVVNPTIPANTIHELVAYARSHPGELNYGSGSSTFLLATEIFKQLSGADLRHIPFNGIPPVVNAVLAGDVQFAMVNVPPSIGHIKAGKLRALAVSGPSREPLMPEVPTLAEAGVPGYRFSVWVAMFAPAGTPPDIVTRLRGAMLRSLEAPEVRERLLASGIVPQTSTPESLGASIRQDIGDFRRIAKSTGIRAD